MARKKKATIPHRQDDRPVTTLEALYGELNGELFGGNLHPVHEVKLLWVDPKDAKRYLGNISLRWSSQRPLHGSVVIRVRTGMTSRQTRKTMAHEMAHLAAAMEDGEHAPRSMDSKVIASVPASDSIASTIACVAAASDIPRTA